MKKFLIALMFMISSVCNAAMIEEAHLEDKVIYPVVHVKNKIAEQKINAAIIAEVDRFVTGVYRNAQTNNFEVMDVRTSYEIPCNQASNTVILSVIITESNYFKGGAHPATYRHALNFNTATGELMDKSHLLDIGEGIRESDMVRRLEEKLKAHADKNKIFLFDEALPLKELPKDFYWDENLHVHFIFQHYEIAPYAAGIIDVDIDA